MESSSIRLDSFFYTNVNKDPNKVIQAPQKVRILNFLESATFCLYRHQILNWIVSILFFLLFALNSISRIFLSGRPLNSTFRKRDAIFYICGMRPEVLVPADIEMALTISCSFSILLLIFFFFVLCLKKRYFPLFINLFIILWFHVVPVTLFININTFMQGYALVDYISDKQTNEQYGFTSLILTSIIIHFIVLLTGAIVQSVMSETPYDIVHPFISISPYNLYSLMPYYFIYMHISGFFYNFNLTRFLFRIIFAVIILIMHIYSPFYSNRIMNSLLMFVLLIEVFCSGVYVSMNDLDITYKLSDYNLSDDNAYMDLRFKLILLLLPFLLIVSFLYFTLIFPRISKRDKFHRIKNQYISGETVNTIRLLKHLKISNIQHLNMKEIVKAAIGLKSQRSEEIVQYLTSNKQYTKSFNDIYFLLSAMNIVDIQIKGELSLMLVKMAEKYEEKIKKLERKFWTNVYLSNVTKLPKIASKLNLYYGLGYINIEDGANKCPKLLKSKKINPSIITEIKSSKKMPKIKKLFKSFSMIDSFLLVVFIAMVIGHSLFLIISRNRWYLIDNSVSFLNFTEKMMNFEVSLWNFKKKNVQKEQSISYSNYTLRKLIESYDDLIELKNREPAISALLSNEYVGVILTDRVEEFIELMKSAFGYECCKADYNDTFVEWSLLRLIFHVDHSLIHMQEIFDEIVRSQTKIKKIYSFFAPVLLLVIFIISAVVNFVILKKKCRQFYKGFAIIKKSVLGEFETEPSKGTYQFRRKHTFSYLETYPAMAIAIVWSFLNVIIQLVLLDVNENHDAVNAKEIETTVDGLARVQCVSLWLVTSILYNDSLLNSLSSSSIDMLAMVKRVKEFANLIPEEIYTLYGDFIYKSNSGIRYDDWNRSYVEIENNLKEKCASFEYLVGFFERRFCAFIICTFFIFVFFLIIQNKINIFMKPEAEVGEYILKQFAFAQHMLKERRLSQSEQSMLIESEANQSTTIRFSNLKNGNNETSRNSRDSFHPKKSSRKKSKDKKKDKKKDGSDDELSLEEIYYEEDENDELLNESKPDEAFVESPNGNVHRDAAVSNLSVLESNDELVGGKKNGNNKMVKSSTKNKYWPFVIQSFDQYQMPLKLVVVDPNLKVVLSTKSTSNVVGQKLQDRRLSQFIVKKMKELNKSCKQDEEIVWKMPETNVQVVPMLKFMHKENRFVVSKMIVLAIEDSNVKIDTLQNYYDNLFRSVYPQFMKSATFPAQISTKQNYRMILIIKLIGFDRPNNSTSTVGKNGWSLNLNLATIRIRRMISQSLLQKLDEYNFIYRIRETCDQIIITFDQENDKIAWNLFTFGSTIANSVFSDLKILINNLRTKLGGDDDAFPPLPFSATALLYKSKVVDMFAADEKMAFVDFLGNCVYDAEKILQFCIPFHLNYLSVIPRDPKPKFTTKIKTVCLHIDGNEVKYDLYIGV